MKSEEIALQRRKCNQAINILVKILTKNKMYNEAWSVAQRHSEKVSDHTINALRNKCDNPTLVQNTLFTDDIWGPSEVPLKGADPETFLTLSDLGFEEKDVHFIDGPSEELTSTIDHFLNAKMVSSKLIV
jgi:hypothetical protein